MNGFFESLFKILEEACIDTLKTIPFLFAVYIIVSYFEHNTHKFKFNKANKFGPIIGAGMGIIPQCGFSVAMADLYNKKLITRADAFKMNSFCSTSGPMFIIGAVGIGMFNNSKIGYILFLSHLISAILNGLIYRNIQTESEEHEIISPEKGYLNLGDIVLNSMLSILSVGCIITIFFIIIECFSPILNLFPQPIAYFFEGCIEITKGCLDLATLQNKFWAISLCSFIISFGGISTLLQSVTMLNKVKMPIKLFATQKLTHAILSFVTTILILTFVRI